MTPNLEMSNASPRSATLMNMVTDDDWGLPRDARRKVAETFAEAEEPCSAGTAELADLMHEFHLEIRAYEDFCEFRNRKRGAAIVGPPAEASVIVTRDEWLDAKRAELQRSRTGLKRRLRALFR